MPILFRLVSGPSVKIRRKSLLVEVGGVCALLALAAVVLWPVIGSPYSGDDTFDSLHPMNLHFSGQSPWSLIWEITNSWRTNQGRFFPGAVTIGVTAQYFLSTIAVYKAAQLIVVLVGLSLFVLFTRLVTRSGRAALLCGLLVVATFQFRVQYDPILQFSLQQPSLMILVLLTAIFAILGARRNNHSFFVAAVLAYSFALLTYETTVLLSPAIVFVVAFENRERWMWRSLYFVGPAFLAVTNLLYLRGRVQTSAPGYTSNLDPGRLIPTFFRQTVGAVPLSYAQLNTPPFIQKFPQFLDVRQARSWVVVVLVVVLCVIAFRKMPVVANKSLLTMAGVGCSLWFIPALVVSQTVRWQDEVVLGNAYIPVYLEYFGFALTGGAIVLFGRRVIQRKSIVWGRIAAIPLVGLIALGTLAATSNNRLAVAQYYPGYLWPRQVFERAIERQVFDEVPDNTTVFSPTGQHWHTAPFIFWWGGPKFESVTQPLNSATYAACLADIGSCNAAHGAVFVPYGIYPTEIRAVLLAQEFRIDGGTDGLTSIVVKRPTVYVELLREFKTQSARESRCRKWLSSRLGAAGASVELSQVGVIRSESNWCLLSVQDGPEIDALTFTTHPS